MRGRKAYDIDEQSCLMLKKWDGKRFYALDTYLKETFGTKVFKLALELGVTCPNRDGTLGTRGCIFCSRGGSGDFAVPVGASVKEQIEEAKKSVESKVRKKSDVRYIAYFQSFTNTYAPVEYLRNRFTDAMEHPDICALSIGTRPDCLGPEIIQLLEELNKFKPVWIELGLQTIHKKSADFIRRGYELPVYEDAVRRLRAAGITVITHVILGLPGETREMMRETVRFVGNSGVQGIKLQLMHVLKDTDLGEMYLAGGNDFRDSFSLMTLNSYVDAVIDMLEVLPPDIVIHRITGDGPKGSLIAPLWSVNKKLVLNSINKALKERDTRQGKQFS